MLCPSKDAGAFHPKFWVTGQFRLAEQEVSGAKSGYLIEKYS